MGHMSRNIELTQIFKERNGQINEINVKLGQLAEEHKLCVREQSMLIELEDKLMDKDNQLRNLMLDSTQQKKSIMNM